MKNQAKIHRIRHKFTVAYSHWFNGTVDSLMRSVWSDTCSMQTELELVPKDWTAVIPRIASDLNEARLDMLGPRSDGIALRTLEFMTGVSPNRRIIQILSQHSNSTEVG